MVTIVVLQRVQHYISLRARVYGSFVLCFVTFAITTGLALDPLVQNDDAMQDTLSHGASTQFAVLVISTAASGLAQAVVTGSLISYAIVFDNPTYIQAITGGQGVAGLAVAAGNFIRTIPTASSACTSSSPPPSPPSSGSGIDMGDPSYNRQVVTGAAAYFGAGRATRPRARLLACGWLRAAGCLACCCLLGEACGPPRLPRRLRASPS
jgi:hypothetical protein